MEKQGEREKEKYIDSWCLRWKGNISSLIPPLCYVEKYSKEDN